MSAGTGQRKLAAILFTDISCRSSTVLSVPNRPPLADDDRLLVVYWRNVNPFCPSIAHVRLDEPITHAIYPGSGGRAVRAGP
jgi:hypothetical protein